MQSALEMTPEELAAATGGRSLPFTRSLELPPQPRPVNRVEEATPYEPSPSYRASEFEGGNTELYRQLPVMSREEAATATGDPRIIPQMRGTAPAGTPEPPYRMPLPSEVTGAVGSAVGSALGSVFPPTDIEARPALVEPRSGRPEAPAPTRARPAKEEPVVATAAIPPAVSEGTPVASSSALEATTPTPAPERPKPNKPPSIKGARGGPRPAIGDGDPPEATAIQNFNPRLLVEWEKSNPQLHDAIVQAATAAGVSSGQLANIVNAASGGDPNSRKDGRIGLTGLTQEDAATYQKMYPELFRNNAGQPVDISDPSTNILIGALKYRQVGDTYGPGTISAVTGYWAGPGRVNELSRMTPEQQKEHLPENTRTLVRNTIDPYTKPGSAPASLSVTDAGTATAMGAMTAMNAAVKAGDPRVFYGWMSDVVPRGMSSNNQWRHIEALGVAAMIGRGNPEGAQRFRELVFQMSHVGAHQALMRADRLMAMGDNLGASRQMALAYYAMPDGGTANFYVTPQGIIGQRLNEATRQPIGAPFPVTREALQGMMNVTQDPQAYLKTMQESRKTNAEIESKTAAADYQRAHAQYTRELLPSLERRAVLGAEKQSWSDYMRSLGKGDADDKVDPRVAHANALAKDFYQRELLTGEKTPTTPALAAEEDLFKDMILNNDRMSGRMSKLIAEDLIGKRGQGLYEVRSNKSKDGSGIVVDRATGRAAAYLSPGATLRFAPAAAPTPAATQSPIGAAVGR